MTVRQDIAGVINNDLRFTFSLTYNTKPLGLTGYAVSVVVKPSQASLDTAGTTYTVGSGLSIVSTPAGRFKLTVPRSSTTTAGSQWYRVDVNDGTNISTALLGVLTLMAA